MVHLTGKGDIFTIHSYTTSYQHEYLPYSKSNNNGKFDANAFASSNWAYLGTDESPYASSQNEYDSSPLNRVIKTTGPGKAWHQNNKHVTTSYQANQANQVKKWSVDTNGQLVGGNLYYPTNTLSRVLVTDEEGHITEEFKNSANQRVLTVNVTKTNERLKTYYVHDDLDYYATCYRRKQAQPSVRRQPGRLP